MDRGFEAIFDGRCPRNSGVNMPKESQIAETISLLQNSDNFLCVTVRNNDVATSTYGTEADLLALMTFAISDMRKQGIPQDLISLAVALAVMK